MKIQKILVPVDFSDYSKKALGYAVDFAKTFNAKLYLIFVLEPQIYPADFTMGQVIPTISTDFSDASKKELLRFADEVIGNKIPYETISKMGQPFYEIIETASEINSDLIIIATHGHTGVEHLLFGSTAEKVVRKAPCPVLTLRKPLKGFKFNN